MPKAHLTIHRLGAAPTRCDSHGSITRTNLIVFSRTPPCQIQGDELLHTRRHARYGRTSHLWKSATTTLTAMSRTHRGVKSNHPTSALISFQPTSFSLPSSQLVPCPSAPNTTTSTSWRRSIARTSAAQEGGRRERAKTMRRTLTAFGIWRLLCWRSRRMGASEELRSCQSANRDVNVRNVFASPPRLALSFKPTTSSSGRETSTLQAVVIPRSFRTFNLTYLTPRGTGDVLFSSPKRIDTRNRRKR